MPPDDSFLRLIARVRAGEPEAAAELIRSYEAEIRREVRLRLGDLRMRRVFDSMDICQSVWFSFFVRASTGSYELDKPEDLLKLLVGMARNKLAFQVRKQRAARRDHRRTVGGELDQLEIDSGRESPSQVVAGREMIRLFR